MHTIQKHSNLTEHCFFSHCFKKYFNAKIIEFSFSALEVGYLATLLLCVHFAGISKSMDYNTLLRDNILN